MGSWNGVVGKRIAITGATSGIGLAAAEELALHGARLTIVARDEAKASAVARRLAADVVIADLASKAAIRRAADEILSRYERIDALINNAGAYHVARQLSVDWIELTWAVNHVAPFLLTNLLLERLKASGPARIITTSSDAHMRARVPFDDLDGQRAYAQRHYAGPGFIRYAETKLANVLFTAHLARMLQGTDVTANCFHPGMVATGIARELTGAARASMTVIDAFSRRPKQGAETLVWLADSPDVDGVSGGYFVDKRRVAPSAVAQDVEVARRLWELSEEQAGLAAPVSV